MNEMCCEGVCGKAWGREACGGDVWQPMRMSPPAAPVFSRGVGSGCQNFPPVQRASQSREMRPEKNLGPKQRKIANVNNSSPFSFSQEEFAWRREGGKEEGKEGECGSLAAVKLQT